MAGWKDTRIARLAGKVALVTGAGSGIGRATSRALAAEGASLLVVDIEAADGEETVRMIAQSGGIASYFRADIALSVAIDGMLEAAENRFGGLDILVNNAGIMSGLPNWPDTPPARIEAVIGVNLTGVIMGTRAALPMMRKRGGGAIVNLSSMGALAPLAEDPVYAASKAAVSMFTRSCAALKDTDNIRVNAILPGATDTAIQAKAGDGTQAPDWLRPTLRELGDRILPAKTIAEAILGLILDTSLGGICRTVEN